MFRLESDETPWIIIRAMLQKDMKQLLNTFLHKPRKNTKGI